MSVLEIPNIKPEQAANAREISRRQMRHLTRIVDDLLDLGRVNTGKIVVLQEPLDLAAVVAAATEALAPSIERKEQQRRKKAGAQRQ